MAKTPGKWSQNITNWLVIVYFSFQYGTTSQKVVMTDAREKRPGSLLTFAMENHTLQTYLGIKLFEIGTNETHSLSIKNTIIAGWMYKPLSGLFVLEKVARLIYAWTLQFRSVGDGLNTWLDKIHLPPMQTKNILICNHKKRYNKCWCCTSFYVTWMDSFLSITIIVSPDIFFSRYR